MRKAQFESETIWWILGALALVALLGFLYLKFGRQYFIPWLKNLPAFSGIGSSILILTKYAGITGV